jgi:hypothetical protein
MIGNAEKDAMLDANAILDEAQARTGVADTDPPQLRANLDRLLASLEREGDLSLQGARTTRGELVERSVQRLEAIRWLRDYPEIADETVEAPVFMFGAPRSGTTTLQFLFARDPRFRFLRTWEARTPSPPPGFDPDSVRRRKEDERRQRELHPLPEALVAMHLMELDGPEECHSLLEQSYAAAGVHNMLNVPSYFDYVLDEADLVCAYELHKRQLKLLQWRTPKPRWALKYPNHAVAMREMIEVHPDARFVVTHRDPVQTLASIAKMTLFLRNMRMRAPQDPHLVGRDMLHFVGRHIDRIMDFADGPHADRAIHVDYYGLLDRPEALMAGVHAQLGVDTPDEVRQAFVDWRRLNPKGARGANPYALEQYGLEAEAVADRFGAYMRRFDIPREADGLARLNA